LTVNKKTVTPIISSNAATPLFRPTGLALDAATNLYISDSQNNAVYQWHLGSTNFTTLVSSNLGTNLRNPAEVKVDGAGNVYVADQGNRYIRRWNAVDGTVTTLPIVLMGQPYGVAVDAAGNVYFSVEDRNQVEELARAFVAAVTNAEPAAAGTDSLPAVLPATENLAAPFAPTNKATWLTITGVTNGVVSLGFTANGGYTNRWANLTLLGQTVRVVQAGTVTPPVLFSTLRTGGGGGFQLTFTNLAGTNFTVLSTTNLALPLNDWTTQGEFLEISSGQYQFTDTNAPGNAQRFYRVRWP